MLFLSPASVLRLLRWMFGSVPAWGTCRALGSVPASCQDPGDEHFSRILGRILGRGDGSWDPGTERRDVFWHALRDVRATQRLPCLNTGGGGVGGECASRGRNFSDPPASRTVSAGGSPEPPPGQPSRPVGRRLKPTPGRQCRPVGLLITTSRSAR